MKLTATLLKKLLDTGDVSLLNGEPFVIVKEPKQLAVCAGDNEVYGWQWVAYMHPENPVTVDNETGTRLRDSFGFVRLTMDRREGSELWGSPDESYLKKWRGYFSVRNERKARPNRIGMTYNKSKRNSTFI